MIFPAYNEIPNVGLFLEQVAKYVNEYLAPNFNVSITTSMISNYVKKNLLDNPVKKQYYRDHIVYVFFIAVAKTVLSLEEVDLLLSECKAQFDCRTFYDYFCKEYSEAYEEVQEGRSTDVDCKKNTCDYLLKETIITAAHKIYLDEIFSSIEKKDSKEKQVEKSSKKEVKKQKSTK